MTQKETEFRAALEKIAYPHTHGVYDVAARHEVTIHEVMEMIAVEALTKEGGG